MSIRIEDFLPAYPNINPFSNDILNPYEKNFYEAIFQKREFYDKRLEKYEDPPEEGELTKSQQILAMFMSEKTLYDGMVIYHEPGTGKACLAFGVTETLKDSKLFKGALILTSGPGLVQNLRNELVHVCTKGIYIPEDYENLTEETRIRRINKLLSVFYTFKTFTIFAKEVKSLKDEEIISKYSNYVVVLDEIDKIRNVEKGEETLDVYSQIFRFLHLIKSSKKLVMSGTPMRDQVEEIADVMNLILPDDKQLPMKEEFVKKFLNEEDDGTYTIKNAKTLKKYFKGRISYLKASSDVKKEYKGEIIKPLKYFKVYPDEMSNFQYQAYLKASELDKKAGAGVYSNSSQASLFVYPNGTWGEEGFNTYIEDKKGEFYFKKLKDGSTLGTMLKPFGATDEDVLKNIYQYSAKYSNTIRSILKSEGISFVYCDLVRGSGSILFSLLLDLFRFSKGTGTETDKKLRYSLFVGTSKDISKRLNKINLQRNVKGDFIKVIIGSQVLTIGFTIKNARETHILTPFWNYTETEQAIARTSRLFAHSGLKTIGIDVPVEVYLHVSMTKKEIEPLYIDLNMYNIAEKKDVSIKRMERVIQEASVFCSLFYERNTDDRYTDNTRECNYSDCLYDCDDVFKPYILSENELDNSTYRIYYDSKIISTLKIKIKDLFKFSFEYTLNEIQKALPEYNVFEIQKALFEIVINCEKITNKYGFNAYLKEDNNLYFLCNRFTEDDNFLLGWYNKYPSLYFPTYKETLIDFTYKDTLEIIANIYSSTSDKEREIEIEKLELKDQECVLENSLLKKRSGEFDKVDEWVLKYFEKYIKVFEKITMSTLLYNERSILRCLDNEGEEGWRVCTDKEKQLHSGEEEGEEKYTENNKYGYYGTIDSKGIFRIRDLKTQESVLGKGKIDKRKIYQGMNCDSWKLPKLIELAFTLEIEAPKDYMKNINKEEIIQDIIKNKNTKKIYDMDTIDIILKKESINKLKTLLYLITKKLKGTEDELTLCNIIKDRFRELDLLAVRK